MFLSIIFFPLQFIHFLEGGWKNPISFLLTSEVPDAAFPLVLTRSRNNPAKPLLGFDFRDPFPSPLCPFWFLYHLLFTVICTKPACFILSLSGVILIIQTSSCTPFFLLNFEITFPHPVMSQVMISLCSLFSFPQLLEAKTPLLYFFACQFRVA